MEERVDDEVAVALGQADDRGPRGEGAQRLGVGGHGPLGPSRGARGEDDVGEVVAGHALPAGALGPHVDGGADDAVLALHDAVRAGEEFAPPEDGDLVGVRHLARGALVVTEQDDALQMGNVLVLEHGGVVDAEEAAHGEQRTGANRVST